MLKEIKVGRCYLNTVTKKKYKCIEIKKGVDGENVYIFRSLRRVVNRGTSTLFHKMGLKISQLVNFEEAPEAR